jgi:hypothetical protein
MRIVFSRASICSSSFDARQFDDGDEVVTFLKEVDWRESLILEKLGPKDPLQVHASGFMHMRYLLQIPEYIIGTSADMMYSSYETSRAIGSNWNSAGRGEPGYKNRLRILEATAAYMAAEYDRRRRRHAFYDDLGYGGRLVVEATESALRRYSGPASSMRPPIRPRPIRS